MVAEIRLKMHRYSFAKIADSRYDEAFGAPRVNIPIAIREKAVEETLDAALRGGTYEQEMEKAQLRRMLPALSEKMSVAVIANSKPMGSTKMWWSKNGAPRALGNAGAWGSIGASMMLSYPCDLIVCSRKWPAGFEVSRCRRIGDTRMPVELKTFFLECA